ncbi:MAG: RNA polymerase sigma factor [Phycisphaerales bacterium JB054]
MEAAALSTQTAHEPRGVRPDDSRGPTLSGTEPDPDAFAALYRSHYPAIAGYILRRVGNRHLAEDLAAETFLDAWRGIGAFRPQGVPIEHWLLRLATNRVHRWARRRGRRRETLRPDYGADSTIPGRALPAAPPLPVEEAGLPPVFHALARLRPKHQAVLSLHYVEGLSVEQVATVLGCAEGTVKSRLHRARALLRRKLESTENAS